MNALDREKAMTNTSQTQIREMPFSSSKPIHIGDNVWVGFDAVILPGTTIGRGSVIGSKSVVSGNIPEYSVAVGNPAKVISKLEPTDKTIDS
jgi:acetyltransferase-like isoleucine patch superfamily enzyme